MFIKTILFIVFFSRQGKYCWQVADVNCTGHNKLLKKRLLLTEVELKKKMRILCHESEYRMAENGNCHLMV
ncbi:hypothetical protein QQG55_47185 [Brugia pahangi]